MTSRITLVALLATACGNDVSHDDVLDGALTVAGTVNDFQTGTAVSGTASVATTALSPAPTVSVNGATFSLDGVPENSAFQLLASVPPTHRATYSQLIEVTTDDLDNVEVPTVSEQFLDSLATGFGVTPSAAKGVLLLHVVDGAGTAKAGVAGSNIVLASATGATGPKFLDADMKPATAATATSASGWVVFFEVPSGTVSLGTAANANVSLEMAASPVAAATVTIADVKVTDGAPPAAPTNVSFSATVYPIFKNRGCVACHSGGGPGKDLGGLMLDGSANLAFKELTQENPLRAKTVAPETSLILTMPSAESPPDAHPNVTFTGPQDPDYQKILVWLKEGAKLN